MLPLFLRKATWAPLGALELPSVKALELVLTPVSPEYCQGELAGAIWKEPAAKAGASKLPSLMLFDVSVVTVNSFRHSRLSMVNRRGRTPRGDFPPRFVPRAFEMAW